ncbi:MAG: hypothetical protein WDO18_10490 [Acidobacteriota bacterium]
MQIRNKRILIDDIPVEDIAEQFGTPVYVYSAKRIEQNFRRVQKAFSAHYENVAIHYAIKACNNLRIAKILVDLGAGIDAASPNEIRLAQALGVDPSKITFTGNNLSDEDLRFAFQSGATINLDDDSYLDRLLKIGRPSVVAFRINPGGSSGDSPSDDLAPFSGPQAKFGVWSDRVWLAYERVKTAGITRVGAHMMRGSKECDWARLKMRPQYC